MTLKKRPSNSSSRAGRFKKRLVGPDALLDEAPILHQRISLLKSWLESAKINEPNFVALSIIATLSYRFPKTWLGSRLPEILRGPEESFPIDLIPWEIEPKIKERLKNLGGIGDIFSQFALRSTPLSVNRSLLSWAKGEGQLRLFFHIPKPEEVLAQQVKGERCVSVLFKESEISKYILGERDHLGFTLHDLIHADHFFRDNQHYQGQMDFYRLLQEGMKVGLFKEALKEEEFEREFEYLISDMNAYPIHLMKCLKSALVHYSPSGRNYFEEWVEQNSFSEKMRIALSQLNTEAYEAVTQDEIILSEMRKS